MTTGFPRHVRDVVFRRAGGRCERCGMVDSRYEWHHRRPRGMGGSRAAATNTAANGLLLCTTCHAVVERHRAVARDKGYLVPQGVDPETVPVLRWGVWVRLTPDGGVVPQ